MIIDDKLKNPQKDQWKFDFPFRTERNLKSPPPPLNMNKNKVSGITEEEEVNHVNIIDGTRTPSNPTTPTTPTTAKHNYNDLEVYYVSRDFFAANADHLSVFVDDELELLEELPGGTWTRVKERDSQQIGLIPTEILESGPERLAKENKTSNQDFIRVMSSRAVVSEDATSTESAPKRKTKKKSVSFSESTPDVLHYPADYTNDHSIFPFALEDPDVEQINDAAIEKLTISDEPSTKKTAKKRGFLSKLFKTPAASPDQALKSMQEFEKYPDHLIRVYSGNYDDHLNSYKTFIVDELLTFDEFSQMVLTTFALDCDGYFYELSLFNFLTAELVPLDYDFTVAQIIEITKREGLAFAARMPPEVRAVQKNALRRLEKKQNSPERDKSSDYVTPFKFVLNRIYSSADNVPIYVHVSLSYGAESDSESDLIVTSLFSSQDKQKTLKKSKWYHKFKKRSKEIPSDQLDLYQSLHRLPVYTREPLHCLIHRLLESLQVPDTLPGIAFEAFLPALHDAVELPLPMNMPVGEVMKIRPKLDQSQQVIIIRPVLI